MASLQDLAALLQTLLSPDNQIRGAAEQRFHQSRMEHPNVVLPGLVQLIRTGHEDTAVVLQASIQLKRSLSEQKDDPYNNLSHENKVGVHSGLLEMVVMPLQNLVRLQVEATISALGSRLLDKKPKDAEGRTQEDAPGQNLWPELVPFLFAAMKNGVDVSPDIMCSVLAIFGSLCQIHIDTQMFRDCIAQVGNMFDACLAHADGKVRKAAVSATSTVAQVLTVDDFLVPFSRLVPKLMECVSAALNEGNQDDAKEIITDLSVIVEATSDFFVKSGFTNKVIDAMLQVSTTESFPEEIRHSAVEFIISFAEADSRVIKKVPGFVDKVVPFLMNWMVTPGDLDDPEWGNTIDSDDEVTNYDVGMEGLDRLAVALGGKAMARSLSNEIQAYMQKAESTGDWKYKHAAILAMSQTAEGCKKQFTPGLAGMVSSVLKEFDHAEARVRYVSVQCIAQFCTDFQPEFQTVFAGMVLPAVIKLVADPVPRVRHHAACTVVNFCENAEPQLYEAHMKPLLEALYLQLQQQGQPIFIYDQVLSSVSAVAENAGDYFKMFYDEFMPVLQHILAMPEQKENRDIKGKAVECISFLAISVGKERFAAARPDRQSDCEVLMAYMVNIQQALQSKELEDDDPRQIYLTQAWGRLAKCIGPAFAQYLPGVLQPLLETLMNDDDVEVLDNDEEADDDQECIRLALKGIGEKKLAIRTSVMEEKVLALSMLLSYFTTLREHVFPFIQDIVKAVVPCLTNPYIEEIRELSVQLIPLMLACTKAANPGAEGRQLVGQQLQMLVPEIIKAIREEAQASVAGCLLENLNESIETCGEECLPDLELQNVMGTLKEVFAESLQRRGCIGKEQTETEDDEDEQAKLDEQAEAEEHLLTQCVDCCGKLMKTNHRSFIAMFTQSFLPYFTQMLDTQKFSSLEHRLSLCLLDDFLEFGQDAAAPFFKDILAALHSFSSAQDPDVVQASVYGLGVCAQWIGCKPAERSSVLPEGALPSMVDALRAVCGLQLPEAKRPFWNAPKANAVSALLKILHQFRGQPSISDAEILPIIFTQLPVTGDAEEAQIVHAEIFKLVAAQNPVVLGEGGANMPHILGLAKQLLETVKEEEPLINEATALQLAALLQQA